MVLGRSPGSDVNTAPCGISGYQDWPGPCGNMVFGDQHGPQVAAQAPGALAWPSMVSGAMDINSDFDCNRALDPGMAFSSSNCGPMTPWP